MDFSIKIISKSQAMTISKSVSKHNYLGLQRELQLLSLNNHHSVPFESIVLDASSLNAC